LELFEQESKQTPNFKLHLRWEEPKGKQEEWWQSRK